MKAKRTYLVLNIIVAVDKFYHQFYFRVNYDVENWLKISAALLKDHKSIHRTNRAQILDDSLVLAREDLLDYPIALETTEYLANELDYIPWAAAIAEFKYIGKMLGRTAGYGAYKEYMIHKLLPIYNHLGFENKDTDSSMDIELREEVINILCNVGYDDCEEKATVLFRAWKNSSSKYSKINYSKNNINFINSFK
jgi:hypothetical protein